MKLPTAIALMAVSVAYAAQFSNRKTEIATRKYVCTAYVATGQRTASGAWPTVGVTVAGPRSIPLGTHVLIEGLGERIVQDRLARRYDDRFDIFVADRETARRFGKQSLTVTILK